MKEGEGGFYLIFQGGQLLRHPSGESIFTLSSLAEFGIQVGEGSILIGRQQDREVRVINLSEDTAPPHLEAIGMRDLAGLDEPLFEMAGRGLQLLNWQDTHQFCGRCGTRTRSDSTAHMRVCEACDMTFYPRVAPCVMALVIDGDYCLLARHVGGRGRYYTALAGFIEAGESAEQCLAREIKEEVGLVVRAHQYFSSQSWPFPGQLMLAYAVRCEDGPIEIQADELTEAAWFHRDHIPDMPPPYTLSGKLIRHFISGGFFGILR